MNSPKKSRASGEQPNQPIASVKKKPKFKVVFEGASPKPTPARKPTKPRVVDPHTEERLTPDEWKRRFAENLDRLLRLVGLNRKDAAREMRVSYRLLRRLITAGVSRTDERNLKSLTKIAEFFCLLSVDDLWHGDLVQRLVFPKDSKFVEKFHTRLLTERERRLEQEPIRREQFAWLNRALGFEDTPLPIVAGPYANKVASILDSSEAEAFRRLIDTYYELIKRRAADLDQGEGNS